MQTLKYSRQREAIKTFLSSRKDHPTADVIYLNVKRELPNISLGTVYRNLSLLTNLGEIQKLTTGEGIDRFDGNVEPHYHFVCQLCNSVIDLEIENLDINEVAQTNFSGQILKHKAYFYGHCELCMSHNNFS